eukprot:5144490-Lingulodinium_polyedra.AAC.1
MGQSFCCTPPVTLQITLTQEREGGAGPTGETSKGGVTAPGDVVVHVINHETQSTRTRLSRARAECIAG